MTLRILLIEDGKDDVRVFLDALRAREIDATVTVAASRDAAVAQLETLEFDLVVCDLKIPTVDGGLDSEIQHGLAAFEVAQERLFGAPVIFLSAFGTVEILEDIVAKSRQDDPYGRRDREQMLHPVRKSQLNRGIDIVERAAQEVGILDGIECHHDGVLDWAEQRVIQIFARMYRGEEVEVSTLRGGLSGTETKLVRVTDKQGAFKARGVMKIGSLDRIEDESARYDANVPAVLGEGVFVPRADLLRAGADGVGAVVFTFADDHAELYELMSHDKEAAVGALDLLAQRMQPWRNGAEARSLTIAAVRALLVRDDDLRKIDIPDDIAVREVERLEIEVRSCVQHGDLHGANLLVDRDGNPKLIDFGRTGPGPACLDAVTLELSLVFNPKGRDLCLPWPSLEQVSEWSRLDPYVDGCPYENLVRRSREWALDVAGSDEEVLATAYAYACRQLLFEDTDRDKGLAIIRHCVDELLRSR